jgi:hypothetical protein
MDTGVTNGGDIESYLASLDVFGGGMPQGGYPSVADGAERYLASLEGGQSGGYPSVADGAERYLASLEGGQSGGYPSVADGAERYLASLEGGQSGVPQAGQPDAAGLRNVKLTTAKGKELNLQEDGQGNLYDHGKEVGTLDQQSGKITMNSSEQGRKDADLLRKGTSHGLLDFFHHLPDSNGNTTFGSEVTVNAGDLTPAQQAYENASNAGQPLPGGTAAGYPVPQVGQPDALGLRNVKLTTANGKELDLQEDGQGDLYDHGTEVGTLDQQSGKITMNSSQQGRKDAGVLIAGTSHGLLDYMHHLPDSNGNVTFGSEVTVNAGDLTPAQQAYEQSASAIPAPRSPSFFPLQMQPNIQPIPLADASQSDIESA